ncbi:tyrosine-type recombinase/integrase [Sporolituus thermophilus]|uniref:Phage integrase family protein n=1 Tax=Sporolituus thermophilus DSM 23256 TaxID=1123285 RepID=A0A1G7K498_9FIRM|nr:site-specific integrase [Sporolituus thermophilus]SDF31599.1 Phage integrase family protein [Sporolituus thermophilus DSM 23256]
MLPVATSKKALAIAINQKVPKYFSLDEVRQILSPLHKEKNYRAWFLFLFLVRTGARVSEALKVRVTDIDFGNKVISIPTMKRPGNPVRSVPIKDDFIGAIGEYIAREGLTRESKLFKFKRVTAYLYIRNLCREAGINDDRAHPHTCRHTFAIVNLAQGVPVTVVQEWLGHANILNTLIYTRILAQHSRGFAEQVVW